MNLWKIAFLAVLTTSLAACGCGRNEINDPFGKGIKGPGKIFSNTVWVKMLHTDKDKVFDTQVYNVTFEPGGRTFWHSHKGGQILLGTHGRGYYQEKGKPAKLMKPGTVIPIPPGVVHWHGAAPNSTFVHIGMSTRVHKGPADWFGPVTDAQYKAATSR